MRDFVLDFLFPRPASVISIQNMNEDELIRQIPRARGLDDKETWALFDYRSELTKQAIWEIKYRGNEKILNVFCSLFYEFMLEELSDKALFSDFKKPLLAPMPASKHRLRERGFNQCELIAEELIRIDCGRNLTVSKNLLEKIKDPPSQTSMKDRNARLKNLNGCFKIVDSEKILDANIILIDDVITTGATMSEAKKTLKNAGARQVLCFALSH